MPVAVYTAALAVSILFTLHALSKAMRTKLLQQIMKRETPPTFVGFSKYIDVKKPMTANERNKIARTRIEKINDKINDKIRATDNATIWKVPYHARAK